MTKLSVNINKVATLRNARGGNNPDVLQVARDAERFGAQGITVHPRPDERHIRRDDVLGLAEIVTTEFNIEGYPDERFLRLIEEVKPKPRLPWYPTHRTCSRPTPVGIRWRRKIF